jgi:transposase
MEKIGIRPSIIVMDAGFFREENKRQISQEKMYFLVRVTADRYVYY